MDVIYVTEFFLFLTVLNWKKNTAEATEMIELTGSKNAVSY